MTGTQALLLVASETGHVYTFATPKLQPFVTLPEGKNLIQSCLNAPDTPTVNNNASSEPSHQQRENQYHPNEDVKQEQYSGGYEEQSAQYNYINNNNSGNKNLYDY